MKNLIKSLYIATAVLVITISCSDNNIENDLNIENESNNNFNKKTNIEIIDETDIIFYNYINSLEYNNAKNQRIKFFEKINNQNVEITDKTELFNWLNLNLETTNFHNLDEAHEMWNELENLTMKNLEINDQYFNLFLSADEELLKNKINKWFNEPKATNNNVDCEKHLKSCEDSVLKDYMMAIQVALVQPETGGGRSSYVAIANQNYERGNDNCASDFISCMNYEN